jgi:hypothetical protein
VAQSAHTAAGELQVLAPPRGEVVDVPVDAVGEPQELRAWWYLPRAWLVAGAARPPTSLRNWPRVKTGWLRKNASRSSWGLPFTIGAQQGNVITL